MAILVLLASALGRRYDVFRALVFAGTVMVLLNPYLLLFDIGFQLSFMATLGLIVLLPHFETWLVTAPRRLVALREFFLATAVTQVAVLPLLIYHIGEVSLVAVAVNVLVLPLVPIAMLLTFLTGLLAFIAPGLAVIVGWVATLTLDVIVGIATAFAVLPFASVVVPPIPAWGVGVLYGMLGLALWYYARPRERHLEIHDWEIVDETTLVPEGTRVVSSDTPVFFR
jgi:competence protein ComEC